MEKKSPTSTYLENTLATHSDAHQENSSRINSEQVENGVRLINLTHAHETWRLGSTSPSWRNSLSSLSPNPSTESLQNLQQQGIWLAKQRARPTVAIACSGQGAVWPHMGRAMYDRLPAARAAMDRIAAVAKWDILSIMDEPSMEKLFLTRWQMPYVLLVGYAQAHYLESLGFQADVFSGHSLGELLALCLSGAYTPETAWEIFDLRARIMAEMEQERTEDSGMLAVYAPFDKVEALLNIFPELCISNYNSPKQFILSGPKAMIVEARQILRKKQKVPCIVLNVTMAFHHPHLRAVRERSFNSALAFDIKGEHKPILSNYTAKLYPSDKVGICEHIVDLDENAVRWIECVQSMYRDFGAHHFVEIGPTDTLCGFINEIEPSAHCIPLCHKNNELESMRSAVARLYSLGLIQGKSSYAVPDDITSLEDIDQGAKLVDHKQSSYILPEYMEAIIPILTTVTGFERHQLGAHMDLRLDLAMRSSRFPVIINEIEKTFNVQVNFEDLINVATVGDLAQAVAKIRQLECNDLDSESNKHEHETTENACIMRSILEQSPINLDSATTPLDISMHASLLPILVVSKAQNTSMWSECFKPILSAENFVLVDNVQDANKKIKHGFTPALLVLDLQDATVNQNDFLAYTTLCQDFANNAKAYMCITYEQDPKTILGSELFTYLHSLFSSMIFEYPNMLFRAISSHKEVNNLSSIIPKLLNEHSQMPMRLHIGQSFVSSMQLKPSPWHDSKVGLPISKGQVVILAGNEPELKLAALQGLTHLGCILVILGANAKMQERITKALETLGTQYHYYCCDLNNSAEVQATFKQICTQFDGIDGLIYDADSSHGTSDKVLQDSWAQDINLKCAALKNLLTTAKSFDIQYSIAITAMEAWLGTAKQTKQFIAHKTIATILEDFCTAHNILWRCIWMPEIITNDDDKQNKNKKNLPTPKHTNFIEETELAMLFVRELLCGMGGNVFWHKEAINATHTLSVAQPSPSARAGIKTERGLLYPLRLTAGIYPTFYAQRNFSAYTDQDFDLKNVLNPTIDTLQILGALLGATQMGFAWLTTCIAEELQFSKPFICPSGVTRECELKVQATSFEWHNNVSTVRCKTNLSLFDISENGRRMQNLQNHASGKIFLSDESKPISLWNEAAQSQLNKQHIQEDILSRKNIAQQSFSSYNVAVECIAILQHIAISTYTNYYISSIKRLHYVPALPSYENLYAFWQLQDDGPGKVLDAQICDLYKNVLFTVQGLQMLPVQ